MSEQPPLPVSLTERLRPKAAKILQPIGRALIRLHITANLLTFCGVALAALSGLFIAMGQPFWGGVLLILSAPMDALDGTVARLSGSIKSKFGAFWDSTLDRYAEACVLLGVLIYGLSQDNAAIVVLAFVTVVGSILVSYARSRAETLGIDCKVGVLTRVERVAVTLVMLLLNPFAPDIPLLIGLGVMAVFTNITVIMRIVHVRREMDRRGI
ncbi:CDP-diacylglycerol---glycerol-3-phosphate 3-phosphatidyltransferase [Thermoflexales bacterium]|nr:CDP-diacylglycerol---glycerol-3-phosphate 3-phosphatidyltransferase [Thermoflexales bacterium]